jgi:hypothetical protein
MQDDFRQYDFIIGRINESKCHWVPMQYESRTVIGYGTYIEHICLKILKHTFHLKSSTHSYMVYDKTGRFPLYITIFVRMTSFWTKILTCTANKIICILYDFFYVCNTLKKVLAIPG